MLFKSLALLALATAGAQACTPGRYACGNQGGAPGPDGTIYVCNSLGRWVVSARCGGPRCCASTADGSRAFCTC